MSVDRHLGSISLTHESETLDHTESEHLATGATEGVSAASAASPSKPVRLALACNQCRKRKVRCDAQLPKCRNCSIRGDVCETSDPRKPGNFPAVRRRATKSSRAATKPRGDQVTGKALSPVRRRALSTTSPVVVGSINSVLNPPGPSPSSTLGDHVSPGIRPVPGSASVHVSSESPATSSWRTTQSERLGEDHFSWQSRAYQETHGQEVGSGNEPPEQVHAATPDEIGSPEEGALSTKSKHLGASSVQCLFNFVDLHLARHGFSHAAPLFRHGMLHTEEFPMPLIPRLPMVPDRQILSTYTDAFFSRLWPIYPVLDRAAFEGDVETILNMQAASPTQWQDKVTLPHVPALVSIYAVISLGINEVSGNPDSSFDYLTASHSLHGHLTAIPYMASVQALFLLALALRAIAKDGQAWHIIGHAIRMAQSIGLHKSAKKHASEEVFTMGAQSETNQRERLWWSLFGLERLMQLECGRPSIIDRNYDAMIVSYPATSNSEHAAPYFTAWIALTSIMGGISHRLYAHKFLGGSAEMLGAVAKLDQELLEWENSLPDSLKPRKTLTDHTGPDHQILATFLSQQYYHAQLSILRVAVIFPQRSIKREVERHMDKLPHHSRLLDGALICANAARAIVTQSLQLADSGLKSTCLPVSPTYLAAVILALGVLRQPHSRLVRSDIELLASATEYVETWFAQRGFTSSSTQTCTQLRERVMSVFQQPGSDGGGVQRLRLTGTGSTESGSSDLLEGHESRSSMAGSSDRVLSAGGVVQRGDLQVNDGPGGGGGVMNMVDSSGELFGGFEFADLWNLTDLDFMVYGEENNALFTQ